MMMMLQSTCTVSVPLPYTHDVHVHVTTSYYSCHTTCTHVHGLHHNIYPLPPLPSTFSSRGWRVPRHLTVSGLKERGGQNDIRKETEEEMEREREREREYTYMYMYMYV